MRYYRVRLRPLSPFATPVQSGTLFGHFCWARRYRSGEAALEEWLRSLPAAPFLLSSAMPAGCLPRPLLPPAVSAPASLTLEQRDQAKKEKKKEWVKLDTFLSARNRLSEAAIAGGLCASGQFLDHRIAHNTINRHTGTTPARGGLYFADEQWPGDEAAWDVYVGTLFTRDELAEIFHLAGQHGFGKDATLGRGRYESSVEEAPQDLFTPPGTRRLSLSHGSLSSNMLSPRYKLLTRYGKTGSVYSMGENPYKYPLTLLKPGATFAPSGDGPFGELLDRVHADRPEVLENAWHLSIPYSEA